MDVLPNEIIDMIARFLDMRSTVRFSRTCWRTYAAVREQIDQVMTPRKQALDEISAIKYDVYPREVSTDDGFGDCCGIREIRGRLVGSITRIVYEFKHILRGNFTESGDDLIIFSNNLQATTSKYDVPDEHDYIDGVHIPPLSTLEDNEFQFTIVYTTHSVTDDSITHDDIIRTSYYDLINVNCGKYNDFSIYAKSPTIVNGELRWKL
jgi:hypothetical protein